MKKGLLIIMFSFLLIWNCAKSNNITNNEEEITIPTTGYSIKNIEFYQRSDTLALVVPNCNCIDTMLDNSAILKVFKFSLNNDTLSIKTKMYTNFKNTGFNVEYFNIYKRMNSSTGIYGYWKKISVTSKIIKINDTISVSTEDSNAVDLFSKSVPGSNYDYLYINSNKFRYYTSITGFDFAATLIDVWETYFNSSAGYRFFVNKIATDTVMINSLVTTDSLKVFMKSNGDIVWRTNNLKDYPEHIYYSKITELNCPNNEYPSWIKKFATSNKEIVQ